ncbi:hypothetical protein FQA47_022766 [Oryzias melastigma]|uniref:Uncharacterized protein n=1 Tax=Oryzias melastigma TaxID=30732 RepID=A0A834L1C1_ORYME|nr:hypothetical protein FQA47_022766 [Oryzias melastigma]
MLNKGKKPEPKEGAKEAPQVPAAPVRPETPKLLRAALEMAERSSGLRGAMFKVKEKTNKSSISLQPSRSSSLAPPSPTMSSGPDTPTSISASSSPMHSTHQEPTAPPPAARLHDNATDRGDASEEEAGPASDS